MKILILHANAGHGHKKVAEVIQKAFQNSRPVPEIKIGDALDWTPAWFRWLYPSAYFNSVKYTPRLWGWTYEGLDITWVYQLVKPLRTLFNRVIAAPLLREAVQSKPDVIITTHFLSAELFASAKKRGLIHSKLITVITDFFPHTFWLNDGTDAYWVMSEESKKDLIKRGIPAERVHAAGIPVDPAFKPQGKKAEFLRKYGFSPERFTILMTSGSFGLGPQEEILKELEVFADKIQCLVVCGNNQSLKAKLEKINFSYPVKIFGFVDSMPELMEASDVMIAKSGGSTTTESLTKGIPMIVLEPIPGQETRNADLLKISSTSFFIHEPKQIVLIMKQIFEHPTLMKSKQREIARLAKPDAADSLVAFASQEARA